LKIDVAVIPAAGRGTRLRPATRVVPKALVTVVDRPAIQYAVEEAARAGATEAVVVVDLDAGRLVHDHFRVEGPLPGLEGIQVRPVVQAEPRGLGHAVWEAREAVAGRPFFCLLADNIVRPGADVLGSLASAAGDDEVSVVCVRSLSDEYLSRYGVVDLNGASPEGPVVEVRGAIEKPGPERAPSPLGLIGRYLFTPEVFDHLDLARPGVDGEIQLTDAIDRLGRSGKCRAWVASQDLLDVGTPQGLVEATIELGGHLIERGPA
jgi:UTP--glucose-1-phosphate uridylyltransferase